MCALKALLEHLAQLPAIFSIDHWWLPSTGFGFKGLLPTSCHLAFHFGHISIPFLLPSFALSTNKLRTWRQYSDLLQPHPLSSTQQERCETIHNQQYINITHWCENPFLFLFPACNCGLGFYVTIHGNDFFGYVFIFLDSLASYLDLIEILRSYHFAHLVTEKISTHHYFPFVYY